MSFDSEEARPPVEARLIEAARTGDEKALAELFDHFRPHLERMVRLRLDRRLQGRVDPADVVQETYLSVQRKFAKYVADEPLPLLIWLRLEAGQKLVDVHRAHLGAKMRDAGQEISLYQGTYPSVASTALAAQLLGRVSTASKAAMRSELKSKVQDALNSMDPRDREVLVLRHFEEMTNSEIALTLEISPTAACNRYVRAIKRLKLIFDELPGGIEGVWA